MRGDVESRFEGSSRLEEIHPILRPRDAVLAQVGPDGADRTRRRSRGEIMGHAILVLPPCLRKLQVRQRIIPEELLREAGAAGRFPNDEPDFRNRSSGNVMMTTREWKLLPRLRLGIVLSLSISLPGSNQAFA